MKIEDQKYWREMIKLCKDENKPRAKAWKELKERIGLDFKVKGLSSKEKTIYISRFYKIVREVIATTAFKYPHIYMKAEDDPADPLGDKGLQDTSAVLEDFGNDVLDIMQTKSTVQQFIFDMLFCFRAYLKIGVMPAAGQREAARYLATDLVPPGFPYIVRIPPQNMLIDPLVTPEQFYTSEFVGEILYAPLEGVINNPRFKEHATQLKKLRDKEARGAITSEDLLGFDDVDDDEKRKHTLEAHRLAKTVRLYEINHRTKRERYVFMEDLDEPIEEIDHPLLANGGGAIEKTPDPMTGDPLLARVRALAGGNGSATPDLPVPDKFFLVEGGLPYFTGSFDVADGFWGESVMAYENDIQNAIIKTVSRKMDILDRFKRVATMAAEEYAVEGNSLPKTLKELEDGDILTLKVPTNLQPLEWGGMPSGLDSFEQSLLAYEAETIRTTGTGGATATEVAVDTSETQINREYNQEPVELAYIWGVRQCLNLLADPVLGPGANLDRLTTKFGQERIATALHAWSKTGRVNVSIAAGSMNILYEQMNRTKIGEMAAQIADSPNVNRLELDRLLIRSHGDVAPEKLLRAEANTDAAMAAELENQMFFALRVDPGVVPGLDHATHMELQNPDAISQYPQFQQQEPEIQQIIMQIAEGHLQAHQDMMVQEQEGLQAGGEAIVGSAAPTPDTLLGQVQSSAQKTQDVVSKEAEETLQR